MTSVMHSLHLKVASQLRPPIQWMGGQLCSLWKGKNDRSKISSYRDISLYDQDAKVCGRHLRSRLVPPTGKMVAVTQVGSGFNGGATDVGHLMANECMVIASEEKCAGALLYVDVVNAFGSLQRRIAIPSDTDDEGWMRHLRWCGFSPEAARDVIECACSVAR